MIIAIGGKKGSGKDTVGSYLVDEYGFYSMAFATKGKKVICETFGITLEELDEWKNFEDCLVQIKMIGIFKDGGHTPVSMTFRQFIQKLLNEGMKAAYGQMFHVDQLLHPNFQHAGLKYTITDLRFPFEAMRVKELGGYTINILRPGTDDQDPHSSEEPLPSDMIDYWLHNEDSLEYLFTQVDKMIEDIADKEERLYHESA